MKKLLVWPLLLFLSVGNTYAEDANDKEESLRSWVQCVRRASVEILQRGENATKATVTALDQCTTEEKEVASHVLGGREDGLEMMRLHLGLMVRAELLHPDVPMIARMLDALPK